MLRCTSSCGNAAHMSDAGGCYVLRPLRTEAAFGVCGHVRGGRSSRGTRHDAARMPNSASIRCREGAVSRLLCFVPPCSVVHDGLCKCTHSAACTAQGSTGAVTWRDRSLYSPGRSGLTEIYGFTGQASDLTRQLDADSQLHPGDTCVVDSSCDGTARGYMVYVCRGVKLAHPVCVFPTPGGPPEDSARVGAYLRAGSAKRLHLLSSGARWTTSGHGVLIALTRCATHRAQ